MTRRIYRWATAVCIMFAAAPLLRAEEITVSAAISMKDALTAAASQFESKTGDHVSFNFLASGPLMKQIEQGAPVDVFVSAAAEQMDELAKKELIDPTTRQDIARGELVLIVPSDSHLPPPVKIEDLADERFKRIGIGEPATVPAGRYATETIDALHLTAQLQSKLQIGINVRQVLEYVERGEIDAGFVYRTDALQAKDKVHIALVVPNERHSPIVYPAAVIKSSKHVAAGKTFLLYLLSPPGESVLSHFGFVEPSATTQSAR